MIRAGVVVAQPRMDVGRPGAVCVNERREVIVHAHAPGGGIEAWNLTAKKRIAALPKEMTTGLDIKEFGETIVRYRDSLYPEAVTIDLAAAERVAQSLVAGGLLKPGASISGLHDTSIVGS